MSQTSTDVEPLKPYFSQLLKPNVEAAEGTCVRLDCIIVGQPEPEVKFLFIYFKCFCWLFVILLD